MKMSIGLSISRGSLRCWSLIIVASSITTSEALSTGPALKPMSAAPLSAYRRESRDQISYESGGRQRPPFADRIFIGGRREGESSSVLAAVAVGDSAQLVVEELSVLQELPLPSVLAEDLTAQASSLDMGAVQSVITTALLITGNTVGAGTLALPELCGRPGLAVSTGMYGAAYLINLLSGLVLAEVAIKQHEASGEESPSSFRAFAAMSLDSPTAANVVSALSLFCNTCAMTYSLGRAGCMLSDTIGGDRTVLSAAFASVLILVGATQSRVRMSQICSFLVAALGASLAGLLVPGIPNVQDPIGTWLAPGTSDSIGAGMKEAAPIMLTTLIFQNIVPPVTRILDYDRTKTVLTLLIGSILPLAVYLAWSYAVLGGGVDTNVGLESPLMTVFSVAALTGSSIGCLMGVSEELQAFLGSAEPVSESKSDSVTEDSKSESDGSAYSLQAVLLAVVIPLGCSALCNEFTDALKLSGSYGIPVLYGAIPIVMAWTQRKQFQDHADLVPGGTTSLGVVGGAFGLFFLNSIMGDVAHLATSSA